jgi:hypothetical protein
MSVNFTNKIFSLFGGERGDTPNAGAVEKRSPVIKAKGKEISENTSEDNNINIVNENDRFKFDLKVFGKSLFQNLILTATAYSVDNNVIPLKCFWKRVKNDISLDISDIHSNSYIPTAEDVGYVIEVEAFPVDKGIYGGTPAVGRYGPILLDIDMKNTLELLLTSGGTKFSLYVYDTVEQEKVNNREIIIYINPNELRLSEIDYNGKEKQLESVKYHQLNPIIKPHPYDVYRFSMRFYEFDVNSNMNVYNLGGLKQNMKSEYHLIAMSKQCREIIYLLIQCFLLDEKIKNNKLFTCMNYNMLPQETKVGITDLISEIKTLREENSTILHNMKILEKANRSLKQEMKSLEEDFQSSLESINTHISGVSYETPSGVGNSQVIAGRGGSGNNTNTHSDLRRKYDELLANNSLLISKEKALREENKDIKSNSAVVKNKSDEIEMDNKKLSSQIVNLELEIKSLKKSLSMLNETYSKSKKDLDTVNEQKEKLQKDHTEMSVKVDSVKTSGFEELSAKTTELQKKIESLGYDNKSLISQRDILTKQKDAFSKEVEKLTKEKQALNEKVTLLTEEKEIYNGSQKDKETLINKLNTNLDILKRENKDLKLKYELLEVEYSTIRNGGDILNHGTDGHVKITQDEYDEYDQLKRDKDENEAVLMQLRSNNKAKDFEIELLKKQLRDINI